MSPVMPDDDPEAPEPREAHDAVADFFAAERESVTPRAADEVRWAAISREAHHGRRAGWWRYAAAAAAVVVVGGTAWGVGAQRHLGTEAAGRPTVTKTVYVEGSPTPGPSAPAVAPSTATSAPATAPVTGASAAVPSDFRVVSVSTVGSGRLFALGSTACGGATCAAVATSSDQGSSWQLAGRLPAPVTVAPRTTGGSPSLLGSAGTVAQVRFANDRDGWVFGADAWHTTDGGATWTRYAHAGGAALVDLETDGTDVVLSTMDSCAGTVCLGVVRVVRAPVSAGSATQVVGSYAAGQGLVGADVLWQSGTAYLAPRGSEFVAPSVVGTTSLVRTTFPSCPQSQGRLDVVAPSSGSALLALCPPDGGAGTLGFAVVSSPDGGKSWTSVTTTGPRVTNAGTYAAAASDPTHLVVVSGGTPDLGGSLTVSSDGGRTWRSPTSPPATPARGWAWVGSPGPGTFYLLGSDPTGAFWRTTDNGVSWSQVTVAG